MERDKALEMAMGQIEKQLTDEFFKQLPNPDKHFAMMPGVSHASFQGKNYQLCLHILESFFAQPDPIYRG